jgi:hypothetical protein
MSKFRLILALLLLELLVPARSLHAIGWDGDDFLIGGGPSFTSRIGVFDHDLTYKGDLESDFVGVAGLDFDTAGNLVAVSGISRQVRVYSPAGLHVGGFTRRTSEKPPGQRE